MPNTEKRSTARTAASIDAVAQTLGASAKANGEPFQVIVADASPHGMQLRSDRRLEPGQAVKIDLQDAMFLGEVCYCQTLAVGVYRIGIVTEQCLTGLSGLQHLLEALQPEKQPEQRKV